MTTSRLLHSPRTTPAPAGAPAIQLAPARRARTATRSWERPALLALLAITALAYIWDLSASGYANSFYAAAVQAGTKSWKAFFFGSLDASNFITVDKSPASLWAMELSARIFGFSSWSMLVPQALEGVAAVGLLYATVRRWFGWRPALLAGAAFALTPVAALMFRFNNPDALLVLMLVAGAYCMTRALERAGTRWVLAAGAMIGLAFLAKMMQAFLVLPAFALAYMLAAPATLRRRIWQTAAGGAAVLVSAGWWVAIVALWPASSRPFIDGSPDNSIFNLIVGYDGLGRIVSETGARGVGGVGFSGAAGPLRLFDGLMGGQASWLLPAALIALAAGAWATRRAPRTDRTRAALLLWGGWLIVTAAVFSFSQGVIHTYYTVALAPAIAALVAIGAAMAWARREQLAARVLAATALGASAAWAYVLLERTPTWLPWVRVVIALSGALAALGLLLAPALARWGRRSTIALAALCAVAGLAGPLAYAADTVTTPHSGSTPSAGPASAAPRAAGAGTGPAGGAGGPGAPAAGGFPPGAPPGGERAGAGPSGAAPGFTAGAAAPGFTGGAAGALRGGGAGARVSAALVKALQSDAGSYRWVAATSGSQSAASLELASGEPVMAIGGFNNQGGLLTLAAFERYVARGEVHYYVLSGGRGILSGGGGGGGGGGRGVLSGGGGGGGRGGLAGPSSASTESIASWVEAHFKAQTIGGETVYDLTRRA